MSHCYTTLDIVTQIMVKEQILYIVHFNIVLCYVFNLGSVSLSLNHVNTCMDVMHIAYHVDKACIYLY